MSTTERLTLTDIAEIADAAHRLGLHDAATILIDALYDRLDGKYVEDLSDVIEEIRSAVYTYQGAPPLRRIQMTLLRVIFSLTLPIAAALSEPRYVVSAAAASFAFFEVAKTSIAQASPVMALRSVEFGSSRSRRDARGIHARHIGSPIIAHHRQTSLITDAVPKPDATADASGPSQYAPYVAIEGFDYPFIR